MGLERDRIKFKGLTFRIKSAKGTKICTKAAKCVGMPLRVGEMRDM